MGHASERELVLAYFDRRIRQAEQAAERRLQERAFLLYGQHMTEAENLRTMRTELARAMKPA
jgi:hypothetical protein